jgi:Protein of unknown function (DUF1345)
MSPFAHLALLQQLLCLAIRTVAPAKGTRLSRKGRRRLTPPRVLSGAAGDRLPAICYRTKPYWLLSVIVTASRDGRSPVVTSRPNARDEPVSPGTPDSPSRADAGTASPLRTWRESRWPVITAIVAAIVLQVVLPERAVLHSRWLLPGLESTVLIVLIVANWSQVTREPRALRAIRLTLTGLLSLSSGWIISLLVRGVLDGHSVKDPAALLAAAAVSWWINITVFGLWYWQFDGGGPAARAHAPTDAPDFMFVQMQSTELLGANWRPQFVDYLYLSFTNTTAFSPTDVLPLSGRAKLTMLVQSTISLATVVLVIARAVNILR